MIGLGLSITQRAVLQMLRAEYSPAGLFAAGEPGVWYDPSDFSTMFQDAAGTTPVTAVEQPVGLILDKSKGLLLGSELVTNGDFSSGTTGWTAQSSTISVENGQLKVITTGSGQGASTILTFAAEKTYKVTVDVVGGVADYIIGIGLGFGTFNNGQSARLSGNHTVTFYAKTPPSGSGLLLGLFVYGAATTYFDNISVRELPGNHATQTTSTSRPVLSARVNLLTATATLATQTVVTRATTQTLRFTGSGTITLSGTATGTFSAGTHSVTTTAGNLTLTVSGTVTEADLRASNMGVGLPAYQAVVNSTTYDTTGFPLYLKFDGVDDFLVTNSINFTATDKMTVFAGVRKLSDTAVGVLVESSATVAANAGSFVMAAPNNTGASGNYSIYSRGNITPLTAANSAITLAPVTSVVSGFCDISGDTTRIRVNGGGEVTNTADQGTGNFLAYPLYIGRRGGTTLPFNGHLYSLIVRGAQSSAGQIASAETWVAGKTGITL